MIDIEKEVEQARYSENLQAVLAKLGAKELLRKEYTYGYEGFVDVDDTFAPVKDYEKRKIVNR